MKHYFFLFLLLHSPLLFAQNQAKIDSLLQITKSNISDKEKVDTYVKIAKEYRSDSLKTYQYVNQAIQLAEKINYPEGKIDALYPIGRFNVAKGNYKETEAIFHQMIQEATKYKYLRGKAQGYYGLGISNWHQGNYKESLEASFTSLKTFEELSDKKGVAQTYNSIGLIYWNQGNYKKALEYYFKSLKIKEELRDKQGIANSYVNIGIIYREQGNYEKALEYYFKSLKTFEESGDKRVMAYNYTNIGNIYLDQNNYKKALEYHFKSLEIDEELGDKNGITINYHNIGNTYLASDSLDKALEYNLKALEIAEAIGSKDMISLASSSLGEVYQKQKQWGLAQKYLKKGLQVAQEVGLVKNIKNSAQLLASVEKELGNYKAAYEYQILFKQMSDSLFNEEQTKQLTRQELNYEFEQEKDSIHFANQAEKILLEKDIENRKITQLATYVGLGLLGILLVILFLFFQSKRRSNKLLKAKSQELELANEEVRTTNEELQTANEEIKTMNETLQVALHTVQHQKNEILSSINYAQRIQRAILPTNTKFDQLLPNHFCFFKPRDIVSGDFYYIREINNKIILAAADCTGHGVPGAFMSLIGYISFNVLTIIERITSANELLKQMHIGIRHLLRQKETQSNDGMDIALVVIDKEKKTLVFAGANNPLIYIQNQKLYQIKGNKMSVGGAREIERIFTPHVIDISQPTTFYLFSDGYQDQFGGKKKRKFMSKHFRELLFEIHNKPMPEQRAILASTLENWMHEGGEKQIDDILVLGVKV